MRLADRLISEHELQFGSGIQTLLALLSAPVRIDGGAQRIWLSRRNGQLFCRHGSAVPEPSI